MTKNLRLAVGVVIAALLGTIVCTAVVAWRSEDQMYVVHTGSMIPTYRPGDAVIDRPAHSGYSIGDALTFEVAPGVRVTHRLASIDPRGLLHTKGDGNRSGDAWAIPAENVRGVVTHVVPYLGYVIVFLQQRNGVLGVMTSALSVILLWGLVFGAEAASSGEVATARQLATGAAWRRLPRIPRQRLAVDLLAASVDAGAATARRRLPPTPPPGVGAGAAPSVAVALPVQRANRTAPDVERPPLPRHGGR